MANDEYKVVVFNEGAPLDPTQLNDLSRNVSSARAANQGILNSTMNQEYQIKSNCGFQKIEGLEGGKTGTAQVSVPGFTSDAIVVATPRGNVRLKEQMTIVINTMAEGSFIINVTSSDLQRKETNINWIISQKV
jgi:hypothetical protein